MCPLCNCYPRLSGEFQGELTSADLRTCRWSVGSAECDLTQLACELRSGGFTKQTWPGQPPRSVFFNSVSVHRTLTPQSSKTLTVKSVLVSHVLSYVSHIYSYNDAEQKKPPGQNLSLPVAGNWGPQLVLDRDMYMEVFHGISRDTPNAYSIISHLALSLNHLSYSLAYHCMTSTWWVH